MNFSNAQVTFSAATDMAVVGHNSEMVDMDNPTGAIYGFAAYVVAEDNKGNRKCFHVKTARWEDDCLPQAVKMAEALTVRFASGRLPVALVINRRIIMANIITKEDVQKAWERHQYYVNTNSYSRMDEHYVRESHIYYQKLQAAFNLQTLGESNEN